MKSRLLFAILLAALPMIGLGQQLGCRPLYVWSFDDPKGYLGDMVDKLPDQVEIALLQSTDCQVLQRRVYGNIEKHRKNEKGILSINDLDTTSVNGLKTLQADWVIFGKVGYDIHQQDTIVTLTCSIEDIETVSIVSKMEIYMTLEQISSPTYRLESLMKLVRHLFRMNVEKASEQTQRNQNDILGMRLVAETSRSTAQRYVTADLESSWETAEEMRGEAEQAMQRKLFNQAFDAFDQAHQLYLTIYLEGQKNGTMDGAMIFRQLAKTHLIAAAEYCKERPEACKNGIRLMQLGDSCTQIGKFNVAQNYYTQAAELFQLLEVNVLSDDGKEKMTFEVSGATTVKIRLEQDEQISIEASGMVHLGANVKSAGPSGVTDFRDMFLKNFNLIPQYPHGALLIKVPWNDKWYQCGESLKLKAPTKGKYTFEFQINDNHQEDNEGSFLVSITRS